MSNEFHDKLVKSFESDPMVSALKSSGVSSVDSDRCLSALMQYRQMVALENEVRKLSDENSALKDIFRSCGEAVPKKPASPSRTMTGEVFTVGTKTKDDNGDDLPEDEWFEHIDIQVSKDDIRQFKGNPFLPVTIVWPD